MKRERERVKYYFFLLPAMLDKVCSKCPYLASGGGGGAPQTFIAANFRECHKFYPFKLTAPLNTLLH